VSFNTFLVIVAKVCAWLVKRFGDIQPKPRGLINKVTAPNLFSFDAAKVLLFFRKESGNFS